MSPTPAERRLIYDQIEAEREHQRRHEPIDDARLRSGWGLLLKDHISRAIRAGESGDLDEWRHRMIVTAALCVAAVEASDRRRSTEEIERVHVDFDDVEEPTDPTIMPLPTSPKKE